MQREFNAQRLQMPRLIQAGAETGKLVWVRPTYQMIQQVLTSPVYAGMFVYGRRKQVITPGDPPIMSERRQPVEEWDIKSGGLSLICSSLAIRNEIEKTRPDLLAVLYQPFYWSWKGQEAPGERPYYEQPVYSEHNGKFASRDIKSHILSAGQDFLELPSLSKVQMEALTLINTLANDPKFHISMMFEPGDMQFLNNHVTLHSRTEFEDFKEPDRKRHLLRMWLSVPNSRELSSLLGTIYREQASGAVRGGFPSRTGSYSFETVAAKD